MNAAALDKRTREIIARWRGYALTAGVAGPISLPAQKMYTLHMCQEIEICIGDKSLVIPASEWRE